MSDGFQLSPQQGQILELCMALVGLTGVAKRPEQGDSIVLDLQPAEHVLLGGGPFCIRVARDGTVEFISDGEAGIGERPTMIEALEARASEQRARFSTWMSGLEGLDP